MAGEASERKKRRRSKRAVTIVILSLLLAAVLAFDGWMYTKVSAILDDYEQKTAAAEENAENMQLVNSTLEMENESLYEELNTEKQNGEETESNYENLNLQLQELMEETESLRTENQTLQEKLNEANQALEELQNAAPAEEE